MVSNAGKSGVLHAGPESRAIRVARDKVDHLRHPGFSSGTREPAVERRNENIRQAAKPGEVSTWGQSPRSSRSTGKPRTGRRGTVDEYSGEVAGV